MTGDEILNQTLEKKFLLHASSVAVEGKAIVFLGHSSSGKSTISKILSKNFSVISDDKVCLFKKSGHWFLKCGDEKSKLSEYRSEAVVTGGIFQIGSFVRIFKSETTEIFRINPYILCKYLIDSVFEVDDQRHNNDLSIRKDWFHLSAQLAKNFQGWHLNFEKNRNLIHVLNKIFEK